jgi:hypothetical protein
MSIYFVWLEEKHGKGIAIPITVWSSVFSPALFCELGKATEGKSDDSGVEVFGGAGSLPKLWERATKWSVSEDCSDARREIFRMWWLRAAMARGHAEWLISERKINGMYGFQHFQYFLRLVKALIEHRQSYRKSLAT